MFRGCNLARVLPPLSCCSCVVGVVSGETFFNMVSTGPYIVHARGKKLDAKKRDRNRKRDMVPQHHSIKTHAPGTSSVPGGKFHSAALGLRDGRMSLLWLCRFMSNSRTSAAVIDVVNLESIFATNSLR